MWDQIITSVLTGVAGVITAVAGLRALRVRTADEAKKAAEAALAACEGREVTAVAFRRAALRHISVLERAWWQAGMSAPDRPDELLW